jgi:hypothetical protein
VNNNLAEVRVVTPRRKDERPKESSEGGVAKVSDGELNPETSTPRDTPRCTTQEHNITSNVASTIANDNPGSYLVSSDEMNDRHPSADEIVELRKKIADLEAEVADKSKQLESTTKEVHAKSKELDSATKEVDALREEVEKQTAAAVAALASAAAAKATVDGELSTTSTVSTVPFNQAGDDSNYPSGPRSRRGSSGVAGSAGLDFFDQKLQHWAKRARCNTVFGSIPERRTSLTSSNIGGAIVLPKRMDSSLDIPAFRNRRLSSVAGEGKERKRSASKRVSISDVPILVPSDSDLERGLMSTDTETSSDGNGIKGLYVKPPTKTASPAAATEKPLLKSLFGSLTGANDAAASSSLVSDQTSSGTSKDNLAASSTTPTLKRTETPDSITLSPRNIAVSPSQSISVVDDALEDALKLIEGSEKILSEEKEKLRPSKVTIN